MSKHKTKSIVWDFFTQIDGKSKCSFCKITLSTNSTRLKAHLLKSCDKVSEIAKISVFQEYKKADEQDHSSDMRSLASTSSIRKFVDVMSKQEKVETDELLGRMIFKANLAFNLVGNQDFMNFVHKLKPSYQIPSRFHVAENLLNKEYEKVKLSTDKAIKESLGLTLLMDGWSNVKNNPFVNIVVCTPEPFFLKTINTGSESHTGANLFDLMEKEIISLGPQRVIAVITDNARNMTSMRNEVKIKYPQIQQFGCAAHGVNLMIKDITKIGIISKIVDQAQAIVKEVKDSSIRTAIFDEVSNGKVGKLINKSNTRWYSTVNMMESVFKAKEVLGVMAFNDNIPKGKDVILEKSTEFWRPVEMIISLLKPFNKAIGFLEGDKSIVSDLPQVLNEIIAEITTVANTQFKDIESEVNLILDTRREFMETPFHYFVNLIDPRFRGSQLSIDQRDQAFEFFDDYLLNANMIENESKVLSSFQNFRGKSGAYKHQFLWRDNFTLSPLLWWKGFLDSTEEKEFAQIAVKFLSVPTSSAAIERNFSAEARIQTKIRNKLTDERVEKLLTIQFNSQKNLNFNDHFDEMVDLTEDTELNIEIIS